jgi:hypothetical protein
MPDTKERRLGLDLGRRSIWVPGALALLANLVFSAALLARDHGDVSKLVHAAPPGTNPALVPKSLTLVPTNQAFDGQFYYRIAAAPFSAAHTAAGVTFDGSFRWARWLYGAIAYGISGGHQNAVPWALLITNLVALTALGVIGGGLARGMDRHAAWGLVIPLWAGFAYSLSLDTSEIVACTFMLGGFWALRNKRWLLCTALFVCAVVTRETTVIAPVGVVIASGWVYLHGRRSSSLHARRPSNQMEDSATAVRSLMCGAAALVAFLAWQLVGLALFGSLPLRSASNENSAAPLVGAVDAFRGAIHLTSSAELLRLVSLLCLLGLAIATLLAWRHSCAPLPERVAWIAALVIVLTLSGTPWTGATSFVRVASEMGTLSCVILLGTRWRATPALVSASAGLWFITTIAQVSKVG